MQCESWIVHRGNGSVRLDNTEAISLCKNNYNTNLGEIVGQNREVLQRQLTAYPTNGKYISKLFVNQVNQKRGRNVYLCRKRQRRRGLHYLFKFLLLAVLRRSV